ncbi:Protein SYM1 [Wickerhamiella sorbophila]|uniref:Protein SYM1 n=1 Tax=Wickerhamiella sorbophila TaxID=45607 RepID=A0A2T0FI38_9ASCO|nr:Protein SYM1 [Wickerhamiella sorbophila]PRT54609.1 Protein SYM1 [Wickerhamiella sorbophila]
MNFRAHLRKHAVFTNCLASAGLFATGDAIAQYLTDAQSYDLSRTVRAGVYGGCVFGPVAAGIGFPLVNSLGMGRPLFQQGVIRTAVDQGFFAPLVYIPLYFTAMPLLEGRSFTHARQHLKDHWLQVVKTSAAVWVPVQLLNFALVPPAFRLVVVNLVGVCWNAFLALQNAK